jgi:hypothetical protein
MRGDRLGWRCSGRINGGPFAGKGSFVIVKVTPTRDNQVRNVDAGSGLHHRVMSAMAGGAAVIVGPLVIGVIGKRGSGLNSEKARQNGEHYKTNARSAHVSAAVRVMTRTSHAFSLPQLRTHRVRFTACSLEMPDKAMRQA